MKNHAKNFGQNHMSTGQMNVSIVSGYDKAKDNHSSEYVVFPMSQPAAGTGIIGIDDGDEFAINFQNSSSRRFAIAVYVDGVNVNQSKGIESLQSIPEEDRKLYRKHNVFIGGDGDENQYLYRFNQKSDENRLLTFTLDDKKGVNYNTINDPTHMSRIEVYAWEEKTMPKINPPMFRGTPVLYFASNSAVGAGEATNEAYSSARGLLNPVFLGKLTFVHVPKKTLSHLGENKVSRPTGFSTVEQVKDPMDAVPTT